MEATPKTKPEEKPTLSEENLVLAHLLEQTAELLESQDANPFRVQAYRNAAREIRDLDGGLRELWKREGREALQRIPHIGEGLSKTIETWLMTGTLGILQRLRGEESAEQVLRSVPGVGRKLAHRIHHDLGVSTLEDLEVAAHDGRLAELPGLGPRRVRAIRDQLAGRLGHSGVSRAGPRPGTGGADSSRSSRPAVDELLDVDREYRERADRLPKIAPRRFNPAREAWLPVLHTHRGRRYYTALFSNTARAHELGRSRDWVVIYLDDGAGERQWTVVTEHQGALRGLRVVRGRERECRELYERAADGGKSPEVRGRSG